MSAADFLLELRCEEIPARMQAGARADLERLFRAEMDAAGVSVGAVTVWSTPRRLALIARDLPQATEAVREEAKGPPEGAPDAAVDGFCKKNGVTRESLELRDVKGRSTWFAVIDKPGRPIADILAIHLPLIVQKFPWPKSMRWGKESISTESLRWVRPLSGIVTILGDEVLEINFRVVNVYQDRTNPDQIDLRDVRAMTSGGTTKGHRFHHSGDITIGNADDYAVKLRACHVIVDHEERQDTIRAGAKAAAEAEGLTLVEDEGLVIENAGLTEWPVPLLGRFDAGFLDVPPEVIQLTARTNQKYFVCHAADGKLANAFVCTANIEAADGGERIVDGNRKVLAARLSDARFFWEQDRKTSLQNHAKKLERITFHEKLGSVADKVERVARLARWLVEEGVVKGADADQAEQAARLAKADLVTEMVGEFPELQGLMGGYYARAEGLPDAVADAIRDHYKPVGQGDEVPTAPVTVAVSLADKLDTLVGFFFIEQKPSGSRDPFALRRSSIGVIATLVANDLRVKMIPAIMEAGAPYIANQLSKMDRLLRDQVLDSYKTDDPNLDQIKEYNAWRDEIHDKQGFATLALGAYQSYVSPLMEFFADRLKVQQREAGVRHDLIDAVFGLGNEDDLVRLLARVKALQEFMATEDGANLLAGYKRAANILKKEDWQGIEGELSHTGEEDPLAMVDDPDLKAVVDAKMAQRHAKELSYTPEPAEKALIEALDTAEPTAAAAVEAEDFAAAMAALASLRAPIDAFFDNVTVNDADRAKRAGRLDLLARFRDAVHRVADFSRIEG